MTFNRRKPEYTWKKPAVFAGGPNLSGGGSGEICEIKDLFAELWNFLGNLVLRKILGTFVFGNITSTSLPHPGPGMEGGAQIFSYTHPPNQIPVGTTLSVW
jgi:hypothetical protein